MGTSSFLMKELNFTKNGKTGGNGKVKNGYNQLLKSVNHSLRLKNESEKIHIINSKTSENIIFTNQKIFFENNEILENIEKDIFKNIKNFENIEDKNERLKVLKKFQDDKAAISKKTDLKKLDLLILENLEPDEILKNLNLKNDTRTKKTLLNYLKSKQEKDEIKSETRTYQNQIILKEIIFKIPENQTLNIKKEDWITIQNNFIETYFKDYKLYFSAIHCDEGTENKSHLHMFISGYNTIQNNFNINEHIFNNICLKHNLALDFDDKNSHKITMKKFQEDFYIFFNNELKKLNYDEKIELKKYETEEEIKKRLEIKKSDNLTITQKHTKLINQKINEKLEKMEGEKPKILKSEIIENKPFFGEKTFKIELEVKSEKDVKSVINSIKNYSNVAGFIENIQQEKQDINNKFYMLKNENEGEKNSLKEQLKKQKEELEKYKKNEIENENLKTELKKLKNEIDEKKEKELKKEELKLLKQKNENENEKIEILKLLKFDENGKKAIAETNSNFLNDYSKIFKELLKYNNKTIDNEELKLLKQKMSIIKNDKNEYIDLNKIDKFVKNYNENILKIETKKTNEKEKIKERII